MVRSSVLCTILVWCWEAMGEECAFSGGETAVGQYCFAESCIVHTSFCTITLKPQRCCAVAMHFTARQILHLSALSRCRLIRCPVLALQAIHTPGSQGRADACAMCSMEAAGQLRQFWKPIVSKHAHEVCEYAPLHARRRAHVTQQRRLLHKSAPEVLALLPQTVQCLLRRCLASASEPERLYSRARLKAASLSSPGLPPSPSRALRYQRSATWSSPRA